MNAVSHNAGRFPLRVLHREHEPAHGLLLRAAIQYGVTDFAELYKTISGERSTPSPQTIDPAVAAEWCGADAEAVAAATPVSFGREFRLLGQTLSKEHLSAYRRKWCPICLKEAPYHRTWWDLTVITACVDHGVELVSSCSCGKTMITGRQPIDRCPNHHDLTDLSVTPVDEGELQAERYIMDLLRSAGVDELEVLQGVKLGDAISVMEWLGKFQVATKGTMFEVRKLHGRRKLMNAGYLILKEFSASYHELLDSLVVGGRGKRKPSTRWGIEHAYGEIVSWLKDHRKARPDHPLADRLRASLEDHARSSNMLLKTGFGTGGAKVENVSLKDIGLRCGMSPVVAARTAESLGLIQRRRGSGTPARIAPEQADAMVERIQGLLTKAQACERLGISQGFLIQLVDAGHIAAVDRPAQGRADQSQASGRRPSNKWLIKPESIDEFLDRLIVLAARAEGECEDPMEFSDVRAFYASPAHALQLALDGAIAVRATGHGNGLARFQISRAETARILKLQQRGGNLALRDAAPLMGMTYDMLRVAVLRGAVTPHGTGKARYMTRQQIEEFNTEYISGRRLGEMFNWPANAKIIMRHMREAGIVPVFTGELLLYRRKEAVQVAQGLPPAPVFANRADREQYQRARRQEVSA